jgi:uncharacterized hydrophobic protein (TIGR00271 family)
MVNDNGGGAEGSVGGERPVAEPEPAEHADTSPPGVPEITTEFETIEPSERPAGSGPEGVGDLARPPERRGGFATVLIEGLTGLAVLLLMAFGPFGLSALETLLAFALVVFGAFEMVTAWRKHQPLYTYAPPTVAIVAGAVLIVWPSETLVVAGYVLAAVVGLRGLLDIWAGIRRWHRHGSNAWVFVRGVVMTAIAVFMALFPSQSVAFVIISGAILAIGRAVLSTWFAVINRDALDAVDPSDTYAVLTYWLSRREMDRAAADDVEDRVFLHIRDRRERLWRFGTLMVLATTIATFGIATDSTAVVIGAMLVAPLMTPILGTAAGLINGKRRSAAISAIVVFAGSFGAVAVAWALASVIPALNTVVQNSQITSRTAPSLLDLAIAVAAGAAGAYGVSRSESSDALPGVAVAIALVPPLAVIGITLHAGDLQQAWGALLLFLTNLFSIVLMAGIVFIAVGYSSWGDLYHRRDRIRVSFAAVVLAMVLISIPLALTAQRIIRDSSELSNASAAVDDWLGPATSLRINEVSVDGDTVTVQLIGPVRPPAADQLSAAISDRVGRQITAVVRWVEESEVVGHTVDGAGNSS